MANGKFLLDTNVIIALLAGDEAVLPDLAGKTIVACDLEVAREYGRLKQHLKEKGRPLPENDIWIAAAAKRHGMVLVTRDRHFRAVQDLPTADWALHP